MKPSKELRAWLAEHVVPLDEFELSCRCTPICVAAKQRFPTEVRLHSGHVECRSGAIYEHTWLALADGTIVDPTERQFCEDEVVGYSADLYEEEDTDEEATTAQD